MNGPRVFIYGIAAVIGLLDLSGDRAALMVTGAVIAVVAQRIIRKGR